VAEVIEAAPGLRREYPDAGFPRRQCRKRHRPTSHRTWFVKYRRLEGRLTNLAKLRLLIVGDFGYLPIKPDTSHLFFQLFSRRYEKDAMLITSDRNISACLGLLTAPLSGVGAKASWPLSGHRSSATWWSPPPSSIPGVPAKPASRDGCLLHHSHMGATRGDSYRLRAKRRSGLLQKRTAPQPADNDTACPRDSVLRVARGSIAGMSSPNRVTVWRCNVFLQAYYRWLSCGRKPEVWKFG
jgi:hypothetical protein